MKLSVVTGATSGIGFALTKQLIKSNYKVIAVGRNRHVLNDLEGKNCIPLEFDLSDSTRIDLLLDKILKIEQLLNLKTSVLVNNAGIKYDKLLLSSDLNSLSKVMNVNLISPILLTKGLLKGMLRQRLGCVINISSIIGVEGGLGQSIYSASKAGLIGFSKSIAKEMGGKNVRINVIAPGFVQTNMLNGIKEEYIDMKICKHKKILTPKEVSDVIYFMIHNDQFNGVCLEI